MFYLSLPDFGRRLLPPFPPSGSQTASWNNKKQSSTLPSVSVSCRQPPPNKKHRERNVIKIYHCRVTTFPRSFPFSLLWQQQQKVEKREKRRIIENLLTRRLCHFTRVFRVVRWGAKKCNDARNLRQSRHTEKHPTYTHSLPPTIALMFARKTFAIFHFHFLVS